MSLSVLESEYVEPCRPYSQNELINMRYKFYRQYKLGKTKAIHNNCKHFYIVKDSGKKEKEILEQNNPDSGNCSVCWKINRTPKYLKNKAHDLVNEYCKTFELEPKLSYENLDLENAFYRWLCVEFTQ